MPSRHGPAAAANEEALLPPAHDPPHPTKTLSQRKDIFVSCLGAYSTAYNIVNISLVLVVMDGLYPLGSPDESLCASTMFVGMIVGQLVGGFVGDALSLSRAFRLTMLLQVAGALGSCFVFPPQVYWKLAAARFVLGVGAGGVYPLAAALSSNASLSVREEETEEEEVGGRRSGGKSDRVVAWVFSLQGVAFVSMNGLATVMAYCLPLHHSGVDGSQDQQGDQVVFRLLLGLGAVPGLVILGLEWWWGRARRHRGGEAVPARYRPSLSLLDDVVEDTAHHKEEEEEEKEEDENARVGPGARAASHHLALALRDPVLLRRLVAISATWFLYDVTFFGTCFFVSCVVGYLSSSFCPPKSIHLSPSSNHPPTPLPIPQQNNTGNTLFEPVIGSALFANAKEDDDSSTNPHSTFREESLTSLVLTLLALPGYFLSVAYITRLGPRYIQTQGFLICAVLYLLLACTGERLVHAGLGGLALVLFGLSFTFFNFGPGATTYLYPSKLFPKEVKATLNGVAAAAGKVGGWAGGYCFPPLLDAWGLEVVLGLCAVIALVGAGVTVGMLEKEAALLVVVGGGKEEEEGKRLVGVQDEKDEEEDMAPGTV